MKTTFVIGTGMLLGLIACDPIPFSMPEDQTYILAKSAPDGELYCAFVWDDSYFFKSTTNENDSIFGVNHLVEKSGRAVTIPAGDEEGAKVWIESTIPYWSLFRDTITGPLDHVYYDIDSKKWLPLDGTRGRKMNLEMKMRKGKCILTALYRDGRTWHPVFELSWDYKDPVLLPYPIPKNYSAMLSLFSGYVTITRLDPDFAGEVIFHVRAYGYKDLLPRYTGFKTIFEAHQDHGCGLQGERSHKKHYSSK